MGPQSGILLREHEPVSVSSYYNGNIPSAPGHYFQHNKRGQVVFHAQVEPEPFNDSTAALNLQRRSSIPLLPAKFVSGNKKSGRQGSTFFVDENDVKPRMGGAKRASMPETASVIMDNSTKITENLNVQKKSDRKGQTLARLHDLSRTLQQTVRDQQIIRRSSSSFIGINSPSTTSLNTISDSDSECFHTSENTPCSVRSAPPAILLLSPISSSSGQFSPSTFSPTSPPSPTLSTTSFSSNGTLSPCEIPDQRGMPHPQHSQNFAVFPPKACPNPVGHSSSDCGKKSAVNGFSLASSSKFIHLKNATSTLQPTSGSEPNNRSSKYHLHHSIIAEGDLGPPPTTIDFQTGEIILKRYAEIEMQNLSPKEFYFFYQHFLI